VVRTPTGALLATVIGSLGTACSDVVVDSIVVERSRDAPQACRRSPTCSLCSRSPYEVHVIMTVTLITPNM
jgi:hypothetical protein